MKNTPQGIRPSKPLSILAALSGLDAHHRLLISLGVAGVFYASFFGHMQWGKHLLLSWDAFTLCLLVLAWARILTAQPKIVHQTARLQYSARKSILLFVLSAACASLAAVFFLLRTAKSLSPAEAGEHIAFALVTVILSWALIHTIFSLQYAYLYYRRQPRDGDAVQVLVFPEGEIDPDYYDFAYFSFIIGMTSQVSDVQIGSREVRRWALLHGLISFAFNTAVLALGINIASGLF